MKIILIQTWMGPIPDYFWFHYETTKNLNIDFLFVTDQDIKLDSKNYKVIKTSKEEIESKLSNILRVDFKIKNNKKSCDLKASFGHIFEEHTRDYDYFGCYDIDTLFGDTEKYLTEYLGKYDFISIGDEKIHNRLSGPFLIIRNTKELRELYIGEDFIRCFDNENVECFEEHVISNIAKSKYSVKLIDSSNCDIDNDGKNEYNCIWSGGKVFVNNEEKFIYHFYRKDNTKIEKIGNLISAKYDKTYIDDFLWVVHFSEKYETLLPYLMDSIKKYSNRKCVLYSINYNPSFLFKTQLESEQFIFRRIDMEPGPFDDRGRDSRIMNSKPMILMDAIKSFPNKKFVHIDTDIYLTANADNISKYFKELDNYPLINSHIHDTVWLRNIVPNEDWSSPIHILLSQIDSKVEPVYPRRKCNVIVFDEKSYWFFQEQMKLYDKFRNSNIPGILSIFDEDTANAVLSINKLNKCLPLVDIEDSHTINIEKYTDLNHPFHMTGISPYVVLPKNKNDILFFHGFKNTNDYKIIQNEYGKSVIENEEFIIKYEDNIILFEKNSFIFNKKFEPQVDFIICDEQSNELYSLLNQDIYNYWVFYISNISLKKGKYHIKIIESNSKQCIFSDILKI